MRREMYSNRQPLLWKLFWVVPCYGAPQRAAACMLLGRALAPISHLDGQSIDVEIS